MEFQDMSHTLSIIATFCGFGAFIDFYIGASGQKKIRGWLESWWLRLSYVKLRSFGKEEALFAIGVMDNLFGRSFFSFRRLVSMMVIVVIVLIFKLVMPLIATSFSGLDVDYERDSTNDSVLTVISELLQLKDGLLIFFIVCFIISFIYFIFFAISVSITIFAADRSVRLLGWAPRLDVIIFFGLTTFQYILLCYWADLLDALMIELMFLYHFLEEENFDFIKVADKYLEHISLVLASSKLDPFYQLKKILISIYPYTVRNKMVLYVSIATIPNFIWMLVNLSRLLLTFVFLGSYLIRPLWSSISTLWLRIIESDKPVFTLVFGGIGAVGAAIAALLKQS